MKALIVIALLGLAGCDLHPAHIMQEAQKNEVNTLEYAKDDRTGYCFVVSSIASYPIGTDRVYSQVPCSPEVEALLAK